MHAYNGCEHTLVVLDDGRVMSFGYNYRGQLGHGNTTSEAVPSPVRGLDGIRVAKVSCSYYHSIIACENGEVSHPPMIDDTYRCLISRGSCGENIWICACMRSVRGIIDVFAALRSHALLKLPSSSDDAANKKPINSRTVLV